jgi:SAM-dependent methyltransferase
MTEQSERYDRIADGYARWWAPIIAPAALRVLDLVGEAVTTGATRVLDVGTGTGTLAIAAARRWPHARITAIDASRGMIAKAEAEAARLLTPAEVQRITFRVAFADDLQLVDGSIDVAVSSFVLQLVPSRHRALRDIRRVLRSGGVLAWESWLSTDEPWLPDGDLDAALEEVGEDARDWHDRPGDPRSLRSAIAETRRAGFAGVSAVEWSVDHAFDVDGAIGFMTQFDEEDLVAHLDPAVRVRFEAALRRRLETRPPAELALRLPTVAVRAVRR